MRRLNMVFKDNRHGALELSIGTIVVIVIGMSMLVLGLVLVRTIFTGSTESVDTLNEGVMNEIVTLFDDEGGNLLIKLGSTNTAKVKPGSRFNVAIGAQHPDGAPVVTGTLLYRIELSEDSGDDCIRALGKQNAERLFTTRVNDWHEFGQYRGSSSADLIEINVPRGTAKCTQKVNVDVKLKDAQQPFEGNFFLLEVTKEGIF